MKRNHRALAVALVPVLALGQGLAGCAGDSPAPAALDEAALGAVAEQYVKLVLSLGVHDPNYVDAYYGPEEWRTAAQADTLPVEAIAARGDSLAGVVAAMPQSSPNDSLLALRRTYLLTQLRALAAHARMLGGERLSFDAEARALYDASPPTHDVAEFEAVLAELDSLLPGTGSVAERYAAFRSRYVIPRERLDTVFRAAVAACRARTARYIDIPDGESFTIEYVTDQPWSGYNWYQGGLRSLIQVNTDLPITIDRAIDLACHEGYPGHHLYNVMLESRLVRGRGWVEYSVYPLFSPQSLIAEGSANYGIDVAFPGDERLAFERDSLFPLAGLDPSTAADYARVQQLAARLSYAGNEAARQYLDGELDADATAAWLVRYAMYTPESGAQRVRFIDRYRSYVINYNLGRDLVAAYVERGAPDEAERWRRFGELVSSPRLPGGLQ